MPPGQKAAYSNAKYQVVFFAAGVDGYFAVGAGKFAVGDVFIAVGDGKRIRRQQKK